MKLILYFAVICVVSASSDQRKIDLHDLWSKAQGTLTFKIVTAFLPCHSLDIAKKLIHPVWDTIVALVNHLVPKSIQRAIHDGIVQLLDDLLLPTFCENGSQLTICPDPKCPIRTCENTFTGTPECLSHNLPLFNPGCTWLTCRCPADQVYNSELKCVNINQCVKCKENETEVCPGYNCPPRTCVNRHKPDVCLWDSKYLPTCQKKLECACANGYFYDTVTKKCVLFDDCTRYWWNYTYGQVAVDSLSDAAVVAGLDEKGGPVWVIKGRFEQLVLPGKLVVNSRRSYVSYAGGEHLVDDISVLCALSDVLEWVPFRRGDAIPSTAIIGGDDENDHPQYIGLASYKGFSTPGRVEQGLLFLPYSNKEHRYTKFEILCEKVDNDY